MAVRAPEMNASGPQMVPPVSLASSVSTQAPPGSRDGFDPPQEQYEFISAGLNFNPLGWFQTKDRGAKAKEKAKKAEKQLDELLSDLKKIQPGEEDYQKLTSEVDKQAGKTAKLKARSFVMNGEGSEYIKYLEDLPYEFWPKFLGETLKQCKNKKDLAKFLGSLDSQPLILLIRGIANKEWVSTTYDQCNAAGVGDNFIAHVVSSFSPVEALNLKPELVNKLAEFHIGTGDERWIIEFGIEASLDQLDPSVIQDVYKLASYSDLTGDSVQIVKSKFRTKS